MAETPGRNDPCPCGSGTKYKKCCEGKVPRARDVLLPTMKELKRMRRDLDKRGEDQGAILRENFGVLVNYVSPVLWKGKKVWAIKNRVFPDRPPKETFHEFLYYFLKVTLGSEWGKAQLALPKEQRHFLMKCFDGEAKFRETMMTPENRRPDGTYSAKADGFSAYIMSLDWDVASLSHAATLPESLVRRLRDPVAYQGARYEIAVAAIVARLDCEIRFLDDEEALRREKRVEFEATQRTTGVKFAVEAKSRHRAGIINQPGDPNLDDPLHGDERAIRKLYLGAVEKAPADLPYFIFIDVNAHLEPEAAALEKRYMQDIKRWMGRLPEPTAERPDPFNALIVTNFAPHFQGNELASGGEYTFVIPHYTKKPMDGSFMGLLGRAIGHYQAVPEISEDGRIRE